MMNTTNFKDRQGINAGEFPSLCLSLLSYRGEACGGVWRTPPGKVVVALDEILLGPKASSPAPLAAAGASFLAWSEEERQAARTLRFEFAGAGWWLVNRGGEVLCLVRERPLGRGQRLYLSEGDRIEFGLTALCVGGVEHIVMPRVAPLSDARAGEVELARLARMAPRAAHGAAAGAAVSALADKPDDHDGNGVGEYLTNEFSVEALISDQSVRESALETKPIAPQSASAPPKQAAGNVRAEATAMPAKRAFNREMAGSGTLADDPLRMLHEQYLERLQNPYAVDQDDSWLASRQAAAKREEDPLADLQPTQADSRSLIELLAPRPDMEALMADFGEDAESDLFELPRNEDILRLFAPPGWHGAAAQTGLPQLTRREHHAVSLDSALEAIVKATPGGADPKP